jgi:hyperosmotically inducible protein
MANSLFELADNSTGRTDTQSFGRLQAGRHLLALSNNNNVFRGKTMGLYRWLRVYGALAALCLVVWEPLASGQSSGKQDKPKNNQKESSSLKSPASRDQRRLVTLADEVRHQLVMLPYYSVFDWLEANVTGNGDVTITGDVVKPTTKSDAEARVKNLESVNRVDNKIEVLPLSPNDDQLRIALYRAIFKFDSPLFRYGTAAVPSIHIIVNNGHVRLKGVVATPEDGQLAYMAANGVPGVFDVKNELQVEKNTEGK